MTIPLHPKNLFEIGVTLLCGGYYILCGDDNLTHIGLALGASMVLSGIFSVGLGIFALFHPVLTLW